MHRLAAFGTGARVALVTLCTACGTDGTSNEPGTSDTSRVPEPPTREASAPDEIPNDALDAAVVLEASLRTWTERRIVVDYTLRNEGELEIVALDVSLGLQIERLDDGRIRLFKGKQDTGNADFDEPPTIEGRSLSPGDGVRGSGSRNLPLSLDYLSPANGFDDTVDPATDVVEFCIGYGSASELLPAPRDDGLYFSLNENLDSQRLACTPLSRDSASEGLERASPLGDADWERTLERVLETIGGGERDLVLEAAAALRLPEPSSDDDRVLQVRGEPEPVVFADGTAGARTRAACDGGGGVELVTASGDARTVSADAAGCVLGTKRIDGSVANESAATESFGETVIVAFDDFTVNEGTRRVSVFAGEHENESGHPTSTSTWRGTTYRLKDGVDVRTVSDFELEDVSIFGTAFDRSLSASFTVTASWTNDRPLTVTTPHAFGGLTTSETGDFTHGSLVLETPDGERLTLDADSGQPGSMSITLERDGATTAVLLPWPEALRQR